MSVNFFIKTTAKRLQNESTLSLNKMTFDSVEKVPKDFIIYFSQIYNKILFKHESRQEMNRTVFKNEVKSHLLSFR